MDYKKGIIDEENSNRAKVLMDEMDLKVSDRGVVGAARDYADKKRACDAKYENVVAMAIELSDGSIVTGRSSRRMVAAAAMVLNAIKKLSGVADDISAIKSPSLGF